MIDDDLLTELRKAKEKQRRSNGFFFWHDRSPFGKGVAECGAAQDLVVSLRKVGGPSYGGIRPSGDQWPDCIATSESKGAVAIEVTELLDPAVLSGRRQPQPWPESKLLDELQSLIATKDAKSFHGGKYDEVLLLIHTDEFYLTPPDTIQLLKNASFSLPHGNLTSAYLLFSYWPEVGFCPATELQLRSG